MALEPELLPDGAILAPITQENGRQAMVRLDPGKEEHAWWLGYIQRQRGHQPAPQTPPQPSRDLGLLEARPVAFWGALAGAAVAIVGGMGPWGTALGVIDVSGTKGDGWYVVVAGAMAALVVMRARAASAILALLLGLIITGIGIADLTSIQSAGGAVRAAWGIYAVIAGGITLALSGLFLLIDRSSA